MEVTQIAQGLWRWSSRYAEWGDVVGSVYYEGREGVVLVDPLVPEEAGDEERFWRALDRDVERSRGAVHVVVTVFWHARSTGRITARYGARVWAPSRARAAVERRTGVVTDVFRPGDVLPGDVVAHASGRGTEAVLWVPEHRALVPGDVILGGARGGLRLCPDSWLPDGVTGADLRRALAPLLELPIQRVLVSHGEPVLRAGRRALEQALAAAP